MKRFIPAVVVIFSSLFCNAECPKELARIEATAEFSTCSDSELKDLDKRLSQQVRLYCPAGLNALAALDDKEDKQISNDEVRVMLSCASRKASLTLIRSERSIKGL